MVDANLSGFALIPCKSGDFRDGTVNALCPADDLRTRIVSLHFRTPRGEMMKTKRLSTIASMLTACAFVFCLCSAGIGPQRVGAESTNIKPPKVKRSKDEKISQSLSRQYGDDELVQIILQLNSAPTGRLKALLRRAGISVKDGFEAFNSFVV